MLVKFPPPPPVKQKQHCIFAIWQQAGSFSTIQLTWKPPIAV
jgi:hypothetical protein